MFALIGASVRLSDIDSSVLQASLCVVMAGLCARLVSTFMSVGCAGLNCAEQGFVAICWTPKATVQAAIGSEILDAALRAGAPEETVKLGRTILTVAVLSIIVTAPLGALAIAILGPRWLQKDGQVRLEQQDDSGSGSQVSV
jgi:NhaP-type Na+/H+ or K+/H+ antiporter